MKKKSKEIRYICGNCANWLYPNWVLTSKYLIGCTLHEGECDLCGKTEFLTPVRDYLHAIGEEVGIERTMWD